MVRQNDNESGIQTYRNVTMCGNWYEDRFMPTDVPMGTTARVFATDLAEGIPAPPEELATTKRATEHAMLTSQPPALVKKPSLYSGSNLESRLATYGSPGALAYSLGRTVPMEESRVPERYMETTNQASFSPSKTMSAAPPERTHFHDSSVHKATYDEGHVSTSEPKGSKGSRGQITRNPREAGNPYGVSVFVDEYANWAEKAGRDARAPC